MKRLIEIYHHLFEAEFPWHKFDDPSRGYGSELPMPKKDYASPERLKNISGNNQPLTIGLPDGWRQFTSKELKKENDFAWYELFRDDDDDWVFDEDACTFFIDPDGNLFGFIEKAPDNRMNYVIYWDTDDDTHPWAYPKNHGMQKQEDIILRAMGVK